MPGSPRTAMTLADAASASQQYKEVRGLTRGLALLRALNRMPGGLASTSELARACEIHRTTAKRLLETLRTEGVVLAGEREGQYRLAREARQLSDGYTDEDWITQVARPAMRRAAALLVWPCNLATVDGGSMVIRESTHRMSPLSYQHALVGERLPILLTALGRAYLAACRPDELQALLSDLHQRASVLGLHAADLARVHEVIEETRQRGYAIGADGPDARFSSVAVPVLSGPRLLGVVNLVFTKHSQSLALIQERYVTQLQALAQRIGTSSKSWLDE